MLYETGEGVQRKKRDQVRRKFSEDQIDWILRLYNLKPILYLDEAVAAFQRKFHKSMSRSHLHTILTDAGLTWKTLERR